MQRAADLIDDGGVRRPGRWLDGGMWVAGLCDTCNGWAGRHFDQAYADFGDDIAKLSTPFARHLQVIPSDPPAVRFAPGLVARCVLYGMFAINPRLRVIFPDLAEGLVLERHQRQRQIRWPSRVTLRVGRSHPAASASGLLASGIWWMRVLSERQLHSSLADVVFRPLAWSLVPTRSVDRERDGLGPEITDRLADASDWVNYGPDRCSVDLRSLTTRFPVFLHPAFANRDEWIELMGETSSDAEAVSVYGRVP